MENAKGAKSLEGIRVLDFTRLYAGPFCAMLLGDLGADVVKVEMPSGDPIRHQGPPFYKGHGMSYLAVNRNKRSLSLNTKTAEGKEIAGQLCLKADVVVENFRPGVMERMGLGYEALSKSNPKLVYASLSGLGASGPDKDVGAFDLTVQAIGGYMSITGERDGKPVKLGTSAFDLVAGLYATNGIITSLFQREKTGRGQKIETSLLEGQVTFLVDAAMEYFTQGTNRAKWGSEHANLVPYKAFETADGWLVIGAGMQNLYEGFVTALNRVDLREDPRFASEADRIAHRDLLYGILDEEVRRHKTDELTKLLNEAHVPCSPINNMEQVFNHPQVLHRGMVQYVEHDDYGRLANIGPAVKYSEFDVASDWTAPPLLGEHSQEVIREWLDYDDDQLRKLGEAGAI